MDTLTIIMTSVDYSDYLQLTLPEAVKYGRVVVATSPDDDRTIRIAESLGAECLQTYAWNNHRSPFSKGAGINAALEYAKPQGWLLLLDSDIVLLPPPPNFWPLSRLDTTCLYGVQRRQCPTEQLWRQCLNRKSWYDLPVDPLPLVRGRGRKKKVWGGRPTGNPIGLEGYFQLWHYPFDTRGLSECRTAAKYDVELGLRWPDDKRMLLPWAGYTVIHLGPARQNWKGRKTAQWSALPIPNGELEQAAEKYHG